MVKPKKNLGQHFLTDPAIAERIADGLDENTNVLEVGPGKGILTQFLSKKVKSLKAVELDAESVEYLNQNFPQLDVINADFLKLDFDEIFKGENFAVIGNFPYNISTQIVFKILENRNLVSEMEGMFQKEVADRICSGPGNKTYGILSVMTQLYYETRFLFSVKEGSFFPKPKVKSGVIRLSRKEGVDYGFKYHEMLKFVKTAFNQRRKQLKNTLKPHMSEGYQHHLLTSRPEQLSTAEFIDLYLSMRDFRPEPS